MTDKTLKSSGSQSHPSKKILEPPMVETQNHCGLVSTSCRRFSSRSVEHVTGQSVADSLL